MAFLTLMAIMAYAAEPSSAARGDASQPFDMDDQVLAELLAESDVDFEEISRLQTSVRMIPHDGADWRSS